MDADRTISVSDEFDSLLAGTVVFCIRRNNQRNRIHRMALDIQAIPNRMLVQRASAILYVVSDQMEKSLRMNIFIISKLQ